MADPLHTNPTLAEIQYCYVNGRMMRDRLINHAIRQACEDKLGPTSSRHLCFIWRSIRTVDVNVHPAKHEVRFHQSRLVHDFIYQGVLSVLQQQLNAPLAEEHEAEPPRPTVPENRVAAGGNHFAQPAAAREPAAPRYSSEAPRPSPGAAAAGAASWPHAQPGYQKQQGRSIASCWKHRRWTAKAAHRHLQRRAIRHSQSFGRVLTIVAGDCALLERDGKLALLSLPVAERWLRQAQLTPEVEPVCAQPLLIPRG